jgi:hypothetical protein
MHAFYYTSTSTIVFTKHIFKLNQPQLKVIFLDLLFFQTTTIVVTAIPNIAFVSLRLVLINYLLLKTQLTELVESEDLHGFLNGEMQIPTQLISNLKSIDVGSHISNLDYMEWKRFDCLLHG